MKNVMIDSNYDCFLRKFPSNIFLYFCDSTNLIGIRILNGFFWLHDFSYKHYLLQQYANIFIYIFPCQSLDGDYFYVGRELIFENNS